MDALQAWSRRKQRTSKVLFARILRRILEYVGVPMLHMRNIELLAIAHPKAAFQFAIRSAARRDLAVRLMPFGATGALTEPLACLRAGHEDLAWSLVCNMPYVSSDTLVRASLLNSRQEFLRRLVEDREEQLVYLSPDSIRSMLEAAIHVGNAQVAVFFARAMTRIGLGGFMPPFGAWVEHLHRVDDDSFLWVCNKCTERGSLWYDIQRIPSVDRFVARLESLLPARFRDVARWRVDFVDADECQGVTTRRFLTNPVEKQLVMRALGIFTHNLDAKEAVWEIAVDLDKPVVQRCLAVAKLVHRHLLENSNFGCEDVFFPVVKTLVTTCCAAWFDGHVFEWIRVLSLLVVGEPHAEHYGFPGAASDDFCAWIREASMHEVRALLPYVHPLLQNTEMLKKGCVSGASWVTAFAQHQPLQVIRWLQTSPHSPLSVWVAAYDAVLQRPGVRAFVQRKCAGKMPWRDYAHVRAWRELVDTPDLTHDQIRFLCQLPSPMAPTVHFVLVVMVKLVVEDRVDAAVCVFRSSQHRWKVRKTITCEVLFRELKHKFGRIPDCTDLFACVCKTREEAKRWSDAIQH